MLVLGLILMLAAAALTVGVVIDGNESVTAELFGGTFDTSVTGIFLTGAATMLCFLVGFWLLLSSMGRARRKRGERKESRRRQRESVAQLEQERSELQAENQRLSARLDRERPADGTDSADAGTRVRRDTELRPAERSTRDGATTDSNSSV